MRQKVKNLINYLYKRPELVFVLIALPVGLFSAFFVPQMSITDENSHLLRIYQITQKEFVCDDKYAYPDNIVEKSKSGNNGNRTYTLDFSDGDSTEKTNFNCGSAASYSPLAYVPQSLGMMISNLVLPSSATAVLFARIANLLFYVIALYWLIKKVKAGKYVFFVIALVPQMIHLAASLSADSINNILILSIAAITLNLFTQKHKITKSQVALLFLMAVSAALLKKNVILMFIPLVFLPSSLFYGKNRVGFNARKWLFAGVSALLFVVVFVAWTALSQVSEGSNTTAMNPLQSSPHYFINVLFNTYLSDYGDLVLRGTIGEFSSFLYHFPTILIFVQIIILLIAFLQRPIKALGVVVDNKWLVISSTFTFLLSIIAITYGMYTQWSILRGITEYADGVQGRYFTALSVLLIPLFAWIGKYLYVKVKTDKLLFGILAIGQIIMLSFYILYTIKAIN